jgi:sacsin
MSLEKQKQFIEEELRLKKYGINKDGTQTYNPLAQDLQKSVQLLSKELYEKDIHFILELIQNAEDNQYLDSERPDLKFLLLDYDPTDTENSDGCLCIFNNEVGFDEENIKAICAVGHSTKSKKQGYIGEKGIGFKSVFIMAHIGF